MAVRESIRAPEPVDMTPQPGRRPVTSHTQISIEAHAEPNNVVVTVSDNGPGLPSGREAAIFEKFERGRKEGTTPGVGLGLAICRAIMQAHGGSIRGETRATGGASFRLTLPRGEPPSDDGGSSGIVER